MKEQIGFELCAALRAFLRQDPNIILVGEIRDLKPRKLRSRPLSPATWCCHTLHTNERPKPHPSDELGIEPFWCNFRSPDLRATLDPRICKDCAEPVEVPVQTLIEEGYSPEEAKRPDHEGQGCGTATRLATRPDRFVRRNGSG